jgi:hypothetical protein
MADMIDAKEAKRILGCDDDTLNNHINSGGIRAQRVGGKLMLNKDDVQKLGGEDDGTIVLTGDSDNLSIDLGRVDDTSETIIQTPSQPAKTGTQSITFGDDLEVVNFDDKNTQALGSGDLSFTDQNTAVQTAVGETEVGYTGAMDATGANEGARANSSQRSVRSNRATVEVSPPPGWVVGVMAASLLVMMLAIIPFYFLAMMSQEGTDAKGATKRGVDDSGWSRIAGSAAGFTVEPDAAKAKKNNPDGEFVEMKTQDPQAVWRYVAYRGGTNVSVNDKRDTFIIEKVDETGKKATPLKGGKEYQIKEIKDGEIAKENVDIGLSDK